MSKTIELLVGLPRAGKTTYCSAYKNTDDSVIVSADRLRLLVYNKRFWAPGEAEVWKIRGVILRMLMEQGISIIIDETNVTVKRRNASMVLAKQYGYNVHCVFFDTDVETCQQRAIATDQSDLLNAIDHMAKILKVPTLDEGFASISIHKNGCLTLIGRK